jgi:hypothetical protein
MTNKVSGQSPRLVSYWVTSLWYLVIVFYFNNYNVLPSRVKLRIYEQVGPTNATMLLNPCMLRNATKHIRHLVVLVDFKSYHTPSSFRILNMIFYINK